MMFDLLINLFWFILSVIWFILPSYTSNSFAPFVNGKKPLDFNRNFLGHRILGNGKTIEGTLYGIIFGIFIGILQIQFFDFFQSISPLKLIEHSLSLVFVLSFGAMLGDIIGAFIKRRYGLKRGSPAPLLDQLDFLIVALILSNIFIDITKQMLITLLIITPIIHKTANIIGFYIKVKKTPW